MRCKLSDWDPTLLFDMPSSVVCTVVWEKFMVRNIRAKKIRGKKFSSMQAIDENFLTPNISYMHILTCTLNYHLLFFLS